MNTGFWDSLISLPGFLTIPERFSWEDWVSPAVRVQDSGMVVVALEEGERRRRR